MKLSLKWLRSRLFAASTCVVLIAICESGTAADMIQPDVLTEVGLTIEFQKADKLNTANQTDAWAKIKAVDPGLAKTLGVPTDLVLLKTLEGGTISATDTDGSSVLALIAESKLDGEISFTTAGGSTYSVPTKVGAERTAAVYGLKFADDSTGKKVILSAVSGAAAQSGLQNGAEVAEVNGVTPSNALHAAAVFFSAIDSVGSTTIKVGTTVYDVPQNPIVTGLGRGVSGTGPQIQFPQFLAPGSQPRKDTDPKSSSNEVITARVETYYFRDAHRLAQILNRGVKSYQAAAVSQLERAAQNAGENFELAKSRRRAAEFLAEQKAKQLRQQKEELRRLVDAFRDRVDGGTKSQSELENELAALLADHNSKLAKQEKLKEDTKPQLASEIAELRRKFNAVDPNAANAAQQRAEISEKVAQLEAQQKLVDEEITQIGNSITEVNAAIATQKQLILDLQPKTTDGDTQTPNSQSLDALVKSVKALEQEVADATLKARQANEVEEQAAKNQFRAEVAAAKADPDTYAPGDLNSVDPVTQVSISVIGEGVLHLRGPRLGVVKIRDMIHQLDHPVGQVKIGIMTVQLNGEQGHRMENTLRRMEGHLSRGRFLTYVSEQLLKRAVAETASLCAEQARTYGANAYATGISNNTYQKFRGTREEFADPTAPERVVRWNAYVAEFFGQDFLEGLKDVDANTPVLDPLNKLLSLSSADSLTLGETLFLAGVAKSDVRQQIMMRFRELLCSELPCKDLEWIKINQIKKGWNPMWWGEDCTEPDRVIQHAIENYTFPATQAYFERHYANDTLNPLQREYIRLVQGLAMERWIGGKRTELIQKRELISRHAGDKSTGLTPAEEFVITSEIDRLTGAHLDAQDSLRGRKAALDRLIKQVVIAMEDDCHAQFYRPAMERIRRATTEWDVELGSVELSTILTNNRAFGKVAPQATYQFDLPKRDIALAEAMKAAYALHQDLGPLVGDPNFNTLAKMFSQQSISGSTVDGTIKNVLPGLDSSTDQQNLLYADSSQPQKFGTELEKLIPDPAIYKFETGTGFQVRPVVQPDGQSVVFDFNYMYTTDLLEPTSPDERSLGRVKRHFVNTEVQLGNLEWREISRYEISLKAARNSRGVPLLEDIPVVGLAFRPLPQAKKSIQKNIIIGQATVYPTVEDLFSLRSPAAAGLPVDELSKNLEDIRKEQLRLSGTASDLLESKVKAALPVFRTASASADEGDGQHLALPVPIQRLSYESSATENAVSADRFANPIKPSGSAPAYVTSPRPAGN